MDKFIRHCGHCNNTTPHEVVFQTSSSKLYDQFDDEKQGTVNVIEPFLYYVVQCGTCYHISLLGGFEIELPERLRDYPVLYPKSPEFSMSVPETIKRTYLEATKIRVRAPNAFAGQIRKALEFLCEDKNAAGKDLFHKLHSLVEMGILPATLAEMTNIIREIGNAGVHADKSDVSIWDAELIDEFFRSVIDYVYIAPAKIERLKHRLAITKTDEVP